LGEGSRFADVLDPSRKPAAVESLKEFASGVAGAVKNLAGHVLPASHRSEDQPEPGEIRSVDELAAGEGGILREGEKLIAVSRDVDGRLVRRSAVCTHVGCVVHWNPFETCWDCPCHGSQFAPDGQVLNGPALTPLGEA